MAPDSLVVVYVDGPSGLASRVYGFRLACGLWFQGPGETAQDFGAYIPSVSLEIHQPTSTGRKSRKLPPTVGTESLPDI